MNNKKIIANHNNKKIGNRNNDEKSLIKEVVFEVVGLDGTDAPLGV